MHDLHPLLKPKDHNETHLAIDASCLLAESREHPRHVAGLQVFTPPKDAGPEFVRDIYDAG